MSYSASIIKCNDVKTAINFFFSFSFSEKSTNFFGKTWRDVCTSDLRNSFLSVADAMRSLQNLSDVGSGVKILVITPSVDCVRWMSVVLQFLALELSLQLLPLIEPNAAFGKYFKADIYC